MSETIKIPGHALLLTLGPAGAGKSTFVERHFSGGNAVVSSDTCRYLVSDDATDQACNKYAFEMFHLWISSRLAMGRLAVADATNLTPNARKKLRDIAEQRRAPVIVLRFATDLDTCLYQNRHRERFVPEHVIRTHFEQYEAAREAILTEGYSEIITINPLREYKFEVQGGIQFSSAPGFDIIGDVHGCADELAELIAKLGYRIGWIGGVEGEGSSYVHPDGRKLVFVGDITDRGPKNVEALRIVKLAREGGHHSVMGNHDWKLYRALKGNNVKAGHGLAQTLLELDQGSDAEKATFRAMFAGTPWQLICQVPRKPDCVVTHAGIPLGMIGKDTSYMRNHAIYGEVTGETTTDGYPVRSFEYTKGWLPEATAPVLVHGHTVEETPYPYGMANVVNVDGGACFGGELRAFQYPELKIISVAARAAYATH